MLVVQQVVLFHCDVSIVVPKLRKRLAFVTINRLRRWLAHLCFVSHYFVCAILLLPLFVVHNTIISSGCIISYNKEQVCCRYTYERKPYLIFVGVLLLWSYEQSPVDYNDSLKLAQYGNREIKQVSDVDESDIGDRGTSW